MLGLWFLGLGRVISESIVPRLIFRRLLLKNRMEGFFVRNVHQPAWRCFSLCSILYEFFLKPKGYCVFFACYHALDEVFYIPGHTGTGSRDTSDFAEDAISSPSQALLRFTLSDQMQPGSNWYALGYEELLIPCLVGLQNGLKTRMDISE